MNTTPCQKPTACWCGETGGPEIGRDYHRCARCGTAVVSAMPARPHVDVRDDERDFYGKTYWLDYQKGRGLPDVTERARADLSERCLFWLGRLLEFVRPPGRALEIGCGHGAFVSLLREVGFEATGIDLSPWVVDFARRTFGVPVLPGTLETVDPAPGFTCIAAFDVLEHLADPLDTMRRCARLLAPDGVLLLQTPCYRGEGPDWAMFQPDEHIYLFTEASARELLTRAGFDDIQIRPSILPYDMWIAATPGVLTHHSPDDGSSDGWPLPVAFRALLDLNAHTAALRRSLAEAEADRAERLRQVDELTEIARRAEANRLTQVEGLTAQMEELTALARKTEVDRQAQVEALTALAQALTAQMEELTALARKAEADRVATVEALTTQIEELSRLLHDSEADRAARLELLRAAELQMLTLHEENWTLQSRLATLQSRLEQIERTAVWRMYRTLAREK